VGITILEMLAWLSEASLYCMDNIPKSLYLQFLKFIAGTHTQEKDKSKTYFFPDIAHEKILSFVRQVEKQEENKKQQENQKGEKQEGEISVLEIKHKMLEFLKTPYTAIAEEDFKNLAKSIVYEEVFQEKWQSKTIALKRIELKTNAEEGEIEIIIVPEPRETYQGLYQEKNHEEQKLDSSKGLVKIVKNFFEPRMIIGTKLKVRLCDQTHIRIEIQVNFYSHANKESVKKAMEAKIREYLNPIQGGIEKQGWPYGKSLTSEELIPLVQRIPGVKNVGTITITPCEISGIIVVDEVKIL
jgi:hypothetical protein